MVGAARVGQVHREPAIRPHPVIAVVRHAPPGRQLHVGDVRQFHRVVPRAGGLQAVVQGRPELLPVDQLLRGGHEPERAAVRDTDARFPGVAEGRDVGVFVVVATAVHESEGTGLIHRVRPHAHQAPR